MAASSAKSTPITENPWPSWARRLASAAIVFQVVSLVVAEFAGRPASPLERQVADRFTHYYELVDQGHSHRFYSDIGPTPILLADLNFGDGGATRTIRIPDRSARPRMVYQRQLALANVAFEEFLASDGQPGLSTSTGRVATFARRLGRMYPGCSSVTMRLQMHLNPEPGRLIASARGDAPRVDSDSEEFYDTPIRLGEYPCSPK